MKLGRNSATAVTFAAITSVVAVALASPAVADEPLPETANEVAAVVDAATPEELKDADLPATESATGDFVAGEDVHVVIPPSGDEDVSAMADTENGEVSIMMDIASDGTANGELADDGSVVFNAAGSTDSTVQVTEDGLRIHTVLRDSTAPKEFVHDVSLSPGLRLVPEADMPAEPVEDDDEGDQQQPSPNGAVFIVDEQGEVIGGFAAPWATDANGAAVATHFELRDGALVQIVDHLGADVAYPVVADPYLGLDLINSASWSYSSSGWTLRVRPTAWARANAGSYVVGVFGWRELYGKYRNRGLNTNLGGMKDQYICHQQFVAIRAPRRATWNLDEWRPNVSYAATVRAQCNP